MNSQVDKILVDKEKYDALISKDVSPALERAKERREIKTDKMTKQKEL